VAHKAGVVAPYFHDIDQQREVNMLGMWAFLATEVMFFGGLFLASISLVSGSFRFLPEALRILWV